MILKPTSLLSSIYGKAMELRHEAYSHGLLDQVKLKIPVLSVGNLSMGGTGKTPVVAAIVQMCLDRKLRPGIISRNYKSQSVGIHQVDIHRKDGARYFGDEPFMLACRFPEVPVWAGPNKFETAQIAESKMQIDILIVDDGFQHEALFRDFDLVLLDATSEAREDQLIPSGRLRESFSALARANLVSITKVNWADSNRVAELKTKIPGYIESAEISFEQNLKNPIDPGTKVLSLCGIAAPVVFEKSLNSLSKNMGSEELGFFDVVGSVQFADHHQYQNQDIELILKKFQQLGCQKILTTEKDFVKLQCFPEIVDFLNPVLLSAQFAEIPGGLNGFLDQCSRL